MKTLSTVAVVSLASVAAAQPAAMLRYEVSLDGISWFSSVTANTGDRVHVAVLLSVQGAYGVAGAVFNMNVGGTLATDSVDITRPGLGRMVPWNFGDNPNVLTPARTRFGLMRSMMMITQRIGVFHASNATRALRAGIMPSEGRGSSSSSTSWRVSDRRAR